MASTWNKEVFGNIHKRKMRVINRLHGIQRTLLDEPNPFLEELQSKLLLEYEAVLFEEETLWIQKSRSNWVNLGDRNTRFFHLSTLARRRRNRILTLKDTSNTWVHDVDEIKAMVRNFFLNLYCDSEPLIPFSIKGGFPTVERRDWDFVYRPLSVEEIRATLFNMGGFESSWS